MFYRFRQIVCLSLTLFSFTSGGWLLGQTQVDALNWVFTGDQPVTSYRATRAPGASQSEVGTPTAAGDYILNFNVGSADNRQLDSVGVGAKTNSILSNVDRAVLQRSGNAGVTGDRQLLWYDIVSQIESGPDQGTINLSAKQLTDMETALTGRNISHGTDNVFDNTASNNKNNIERIDFIFPTVLEAQDLSVVAPSYTGNFDDQLEFGFPLIERGGNDTLKIAPILDVNAAGNVSRYGELLTINTSDWGQNLLDMDTLVVRGDNYPSNTQYQPSATVEGQSLAAVFITLRDLGINVGESFYGYSLFGGDVDPGIAFASNPTTYSNRLLDVSNQTVFPQNTNGADGGLDLVSGGIFFDSEGIPANGFITNTPIATPVPFESDVLPGLLIAGALVGWELRRRKRAQDAGLPLASNA